MKKIAIVFALVGLVVGVAYAESLQDINKRYLEKEASTIKEAPNLSLKEIFKRDYREEVKLVKIMSEARAEVDAEFQIQKNKPLINKIFIAIWNNLPKITPLIIGLGVIYIAFQQHKTNRARFKMELFDRRYKIYDAMIELVTNEEITKDDTKRYLVKVAPALFIFGEDVCKALAKVGQIASEIAKLSGAGIRSRNISDVPRYNALCNIFKEAAEEATIIFNKYLAFKKTKKNPANKINKE